LRRRSVGGAAGGELIFRAPESKSRAGAYKVKSKKTDATHFVEEDK
jgi:hypothetical protein